MADVELGEEGECETEEEDRRGRSRVALKRSNVTGGRERERERDFARLRRSLIEPPAGSCALSLPEPIESKF